MKYVVKVGEWPTEDAEFDEHQDVFDTIDAAKAYLGRQREAGNVAHLHELLGYMLTDQGARVPEVGRRIDL